MVRLRRFLDYVWQAYEDKLSALRSFMAKRVPEQEREDVYQDFAEAVCRADREALARDPGAVLVVLMRKTIYEHYQRRPGLAADTFTLEELENLPAAGDGPDDEADAALVGERLRRALQTLTPRQCAVLIQCTFLGKTYKEAARDLHLSVHIVERDLSAAMKTLKETLWKS